jgi:NAD-specific glutamate dehydrogenase
MGLDSENVKIEATQTTLSRHRDLAKLLYLDFKSRLEGRGEDPTLKAKLQVADAKDAQLLNTIRTFNKSCLKTNFYKEEIGAVGFRLDPSVFLKKQKLPEIPFGIFMLIGRDFNGFHLRFRDISRGGIRMILSSKDNYDKNRIT